MEAARGISALGRGSDGRYSETTKKDAWDVTGTGNQESSGRAATRHQEAGGGERA